MAKFQQYGANAEDLYVRKGRTLQEIAQLLGLSVQTLSRWKIRHHWAEKRREYQVSTPGTIALLEDVLAEKVQELRGLPADEVNSKRIDAITKLVSSIQKLRREDDLRTQTVHVMSEFSRFVRQKKLKERELDMVIGLVHEFFEFVREA